VHLGDVLIHCGQLRVSGFDDNVDTIADDVEFAIGDKDGDFDQYVAFEGEPSHLTINPDQMWVLKCHGANVSAAGGLGINFTTRSPSRNHPSAHFHRRNSSITS
jgi:predicted phosphodiesterase